MKIPMGNFGNQVAGAGPAPQFSPNAFGAQEAAATTQLGNSEGQIAQTQHTFDVQQENALARTSALTAYQTHQTNVKVALQDAGEALSSNLITPDDYTKRVNEATQQSYESTIGALPDSQYKQAASMQNVGLDRAAKLQMGSTLTKYTQQQNAANVGALLDNAGKDIAVDPGNIAQTTASTKAAFLATAPSAGISTAKANEMYTNWENQQYTQHATLAAIQARGSGDAAALTQLERDLTSPDGFYAGKMTAQQRNSVLSSVVSQRLTLENQTAAEAQARENQAVTAFNQASDLLTAGKQFSPAFIKQLNDATSGTAVAEDTQRLITAAGQNAGFSSLSLPAMRAAIQKDQSDANTPGVGTDPLTAKAVKVRQQIYDASVEAYKKDPWNAALDRGVIQSIPQIDTSSVPNLLTSLVQRTAMAGTIDQQAGRRVSLLTPDEASKALDFVNALGTDAKAQVLTQVGAAFNNAARINDLAEQWKEKNPSVALALKAGSAGGDGQPLMTTKGRPVASYILDGQQAIVDKTVKIDDVAGTGMKAQIANAVNGTLPPNQEADAKEMAYYIAVSNAHRNGREQPNAADVQGGIDTATGGISKTGGGALPTGKDRTVARPYGWTDDEFQGSVKTASVGNIENQIGGKPIDTVYANGKPIAAGDFMSKFSNYQLMRVGVRGTYAVVTGSKFVTDEAGRRVTVHLTRAQTPQQAAAPVASASASTTDNPF